MKTLYETVDYSEALVIKALLEQAGFLVYLDGMHTLAACPHWTVGLGLRLYVAQADFDPATHLLLEVRRENVFGLATEDSVDACPKCGWEDIVRYTSLLVLPILVALGLLLPVPNGNKRACNTCGHKYKTKGPAIAGPLKLVLFFWIVFFLTYFAYEVYYIWPEGPGLEHYWPSGWFYD
ncbi:MULTISPECIES: putative signal transducing protein [Kordiimonas]|jgi:hypothetical protein|uniref:putative signal transducing protein n=1 Tax=Kordiimonas TaxID=288021 RepID=UPI00257FC19F|nr:DUF2007 domain-containing protein [Kordiimonas sp. UBA4487]